MGAENLPAPNIAECFAAFEWLRSQCEAGNDHAGVAMAELVRLRSIEKSHTQPPGESQHLRNALDHIVRVAAASRSGTRRLTWIKARAQSALEGNDAWCDLPFPKGRSLSREFVPQPVESEGGHVD